MRVLLLSLLQLHDMAALYSRLPCSVVYNM